MTPIRSFSRQRDPMSSVGQIERQHVEWKPWRRGIQRVFEACRQAGTPEPRIRVEPRDLWFELPFSAAYLESLGAGGVKYHLGKLKAAGRIRRLGPARGGRWEVLRGADE